MKKKQNYALGSLLLGAASWLCLLGLRHIERRMKRNEGKYKNAPQDKLPARRFLFPPLVFLHAFRILRCKRMRSAIMAMNSLLVGLPFVFETV